jgi:hypothetical protein
LAKAVTIIGQRNAARGGVERVYGAVNVPLETFDATTEEENLRAAVTALRIYKYMAPVPVRTILMRQSRPAERNRNLERCHVIIFPSHSKLRLPTWLKYYFPA